MSQAGYRNRGPLPLLETGRLGSAARGRVGHNPAPARGAAAGDATNRPNGRGMGADAQLGCADGSHALPRTITPAGGGRWVDTRVVRPAFSRSPAFLRRRRLPLRARTRRRTVRLSIG